MLGTIPFLFSDIKMLNCSVISFKCRHGHYHDMVNGISAYKFYNA